GIEVIGGVQKWIVPCNWKFPAENFAGDAYHVPWSHLSAINTGFSPTVTARKAWKGSLLSPGHGHGIIALGPEDTAAAPEPAILAYEAEIRPEVMRPLGSRSALINPIPELLPAPRARQHLPRRPSPGPGQARNLVLELCRQGRLPSDQGRLPPRQSAEFQPGRHLRARRHGQLASVHPDLPRRGVPA